MASISDEGNRRKPCKFGRAALATGTLSSLRSGRGYRGPRWAARGPSDSALTFVCFRL
jgi:hypothetical protein